MRYAGRIFLFCYRIAARLRNKCFSRAIAGAFAHFGKHTVVECPVRLSGEDRISIGDRVFVGAGSWLQTLRNGFDRSVAIWIGNGVSIAGGCVISAVSEVRLEDHVLIARNVYLADHSHKYTDAGTPVLAQGLDKVAPVVVGRGAWIGENAVICPGVTIGKGAVIGANSVVTRAVPDYSVAVGAPARIVKTLAVAAGTN